MKGWWCCGICSCKETKAISCRGSSGEHIRNVFYIFMVTGINRLQGGFVWSSWDFKKKQLVNLMTGGCYLCRVWKMKDFTNSSRWLDELLASLLWQMHQQSSIKHLLIQGHTALRVICVDNGAFMLCYSLSPQGINLLQSYKLNEKASWLLCLFFSHRAHHAEYC